MLKAILLLGVFGAGVAVGVIAMRSQYKPTEGQVPAATASTASSASPRVIATSEVEAPDAHGATPLAAVSLPSANPASAAAPTADVPDAAQAAGTGIFQPIDAGAVFNKMLARPSQPGNENQIGEAHHALEREMRDEGWANTMEAELQNAMVNEVSMGAFKAEHIECRATMCEVRLSGNATQGAAIKAWQDGLMGQPFGQRLFLNYGSSISNNDQTDMLMIFRKPPPPGSAPQQAPQKVTQRRQVTG